MKLWVDDIRPAPDHTWMVARTVTSAVNAIALFGGQMTEISLDHDISHQVSIGTKLERPFPCEETFQPVAWVIAFYYRNLPQMPKIIIHTSNPNGADKMKDIIRGEIQEAEIIRKPMGAANRLEMEV